MAAPEWKQRIFERVSTHIGPEPERFDIHESQTRNRAITALLTEDPQIRAGLLREFYSWQRRKKRDARRSGTATGGLHS